MYYLLLKNKIEKKADVDKLDIKFNHAMSMLKFHTSYREQAVLQDIESIEIKEHGIPGDRLITADIYNHDENGFQFIIVDERQNAIKRKPGEITQ